MTTPTTFWRLAGMSYVQVRLCFACYVSGLGLCDGGWLVVILRCPDPEGGEGLCGVWCRWTRLSGAVPGGLSFALLCVGGEVPIRCVGRKGKSGCVIWGGGTEEGRRLHRSGTGGHSTCCAGRSPSNPNGHHRADCTWHDRTRMNGSYLYRLWRSVLCVGGDGDEQKQSALGAFVSEAARGRSMLMSELSKDPLGIVLPILC